MSDKVVEKNKVVTFKCTILDEDDNIVEKNDMPMSYVHGGEAGDFLEDMQVMEGAKVGDTKRVTVSAAQGFGEFDETLVIRDKIENVPEEYHKVGTICSFQNDKGEPMSFRVKSIDNGEIVFDGNHPYAGKAMTFKMTITDIRDATVDEIGSGRPAEYQQENSKAH
jgi:FKBP-type peptidyl-prolyl cis-trans isomerase SlyD